MKNYIFAGLAVVGLAGLSPAEEQAQPDPKPQTTVAPAAPITPKVTAEKRASRVVIGFLESRDRIITLKTSDRGPVYSAATKSGKVLFENLSLAQLKAQAPEIHDLIKTSVAGDANGELGIIDASVQRRPLIDAGLVR